MRRITFWFDVVSPFACLAFHRLPQELVGLSYEVAYRPLRRAGLREHWGHGTSAELAPRGVWTLRHAHWTAQRHGIALCTPARLPFEPDALLRLALACGPNRRVVEAVFAHVWRAGGDPCDTSRLATLTAQLAPRRDPAGAAIGAELHAATDEAIGRGVFDVPSFELDGRLFWGLDALPMLRAALAGDAWFDGPDWANAGAPPPPAARG